MTSAAKEAASYCPLELSAKVSLISLYSLCRICRVYIEEKMAPLNVIIYLLLLISATASPPFLNGIAYIRSGLGSISLILYITLPTTTSRLQQKIRRPLRRLGNRRLLIRRRSWRWELCAVMKHLQFLSLKRLQWLVSCI